MTRNRKKIKFFRDFPGDLRSSTAVEEKRPLHVDTVAFIDFTTLVDAARPPTVPEQMWMRRAPLQIDHAFTIDRYRIDTQMQIHHDRPQMRMRVVHI